MQVGAAGRAFKQFLKTGSAEQAHAGDIKDIEAQIAELEAKAPHTESLYQDFENLKALAERVLGEQAKVPPTELHRTMFDMPVNSAEALVQLGVRRAVNARLQSGWYRDRLVFLVNAEKSSSTLHEIVIRDILQYSRGMTPNFGIQRGLRFGPTELASESTIHGLLPMYAPDGGVVRSPYLPTPGNIRYINWLGAKVVLLTRHPADRIVARACMNRDEDGAQEFTRCLEDGTAFDRYFTIRSNAALRYDLEWMAGWLDTLGATGRMHVVRYEDMMADPWAHFDGIHQFLADAPLSAELRRIIEDKMSRTKSGGDLQPGALDGRTYPRGYSGKVGVWKDYFSPEDVAKYNTIVRNYMEYEPQARKISEVYPDIILENAEDLAHEDSEVFR